MGLTVEQAEVVFDISTIQVGHLLYAKHSSWKEGKAGFVTSVTKEQMIVQYHPKIGNVTNHFFLPIHEVIKNEWEIRWSVDLSEVWSYSSNEKNESELEQINGEEE